jgi:hypothetical protein
LELKEDKSVGNRSFKFGWLAKGALVVGALALVAMSAPANAATLRRSGTTGANANGGNGGPTGNYLFTWFATLNDGGNGDNVLRLIDPNGCSNGFGISNGACTSEVDQCAMIYVFDDDQEMGECCGCPITPNELEEYSVEDDLANNFQQASPDNGAGVIVVVGSAINAPLGCNPANQTCNQIAPGPGVPGCDPTVPAVTAGDTNLDGSITHNQVIGGVSGLTEIPLFDQGAGDPVDDAYLVNECGAIAGNATASAGFCHCPSVD